MNELLMLSINRGAWLLGIGLILCLAFYKFNIKRFIKGNVGIRYLSWLVLGPAYVFAVVIGTPISLLVLLLVMLAGIWEVGRMAKLSTGFKVLLYVLAPISIFLATTQIFYMLPLIYMFSCIIIGILHNKKEILPQVTLVVFTALWILFGLAHFVLLGFKFGAFPLVLLGFAVPLSDVFAYLIGNFFSKFPSLDKHKVASNISPKKSYAGVLGNILGIGVGFILLLPLSLQLFSVYEAVLVVIVLGIVGFIGDLTVSMMKRYCKVKDSSNLIPGHGGVLDRVDSMISIILVFYYLLLIL